MNKYVDQQLMLDLFGLTPNGADVSWNISAHFSKSQRGAYECAIKITGDEAPECAPGIGGDPFQAVLLAIAGLRRLIAQRESAGWSFFLSEDKNIRSKYSSGIWLASARLLLK